MKVENHYAVIGVHRKSTDVEIKAAYSLLARAYHPDRNPDGAGQMAEINVAYNILKNPKEKAQYDKMLSIMGRQCSKCKGVGALKKQKGFSKVQYVTCDACKGCGTNHGV